MITFTSGNMFDIAADIRINTVNCVGVMGAGLALAFKTKYPDMFRAYQKACKAGEVKPGKLHVWKELYGDWIINFPTKRHWREPSRYEDIESGLIALKKYLADQGKLKVLLPAVGCGHGGLDWSRISEMIRKHLKDLEADIIVFEPADSREAGNKIKESEEETIKSRLIDHGIKTLEPGAELYPSALLGRSAIKLYVKGSPQQLALPNLFLLPSVKPLEREIEATMKAVSMTMRPGVSLLVGYGAAIERPAIKLALEKGSDIIIFISEGILGFQVRRDLLDVWDENRIIIISAAKPLERWSPSAAFRTKDLQLSIATATLITDNSVQTISKMLLQKASHHLSPIFYLDYGVVDPHTNNVYKKIKAQSVKVSEIIDNDNIDAFSGLFHAMGIKEPAVEEPLAAAQSLSERSVQYGSLSSDGSADRVNKALANDTKKGIPKRLIEVDLPIKRISAHARREKSIRHGHISTLHTWWARRPLAACRAVICAALWPDPADPLCPGTFRDKAHTLMKEWADKHTILLTSQESLKRFIQIQKTPDKLKDHVYLRQALLDFIADFANWDNSTVKEYLETSRALTQAAHEALGGEPGTRPLVVDPFAGGGAIPLEALRVGADVFASDLNPVAVLLNKVVLQYIPRFGHQLVEEIRKWGEWIKKEAEKKLAEFYPKDPDGATPMAYLWARTITCEGPGCGTEVPLMRSLWLTKKGSHSTALRILPNIQERQIDFKIIDDAKARDVVEGTIRRGSAICPLCGYTTPVTSVRKQLKTHCGGAANARLLAVVTTRPGQQGRFYRLPLKKDFVALAKANQELLLRIKQHTEALSLVPDEPLPPQGTLGFRVQLYGMETWGNFFTPRQALALITLTNLVKEVGKKLAGQSDSGLKLAVQTILAFAIDKQADLGNSLNRWEPIAQCPRQLFGRQAIPIVWDFAESAPLGSSSGAFEIFIDGITSALEKVGCNWHEGHVNISSATRHPLPDDSAEIFFSDPPYYDAIPYADLSDFFFVWLKRTIGDEYPLYFDSPLTPKKDECIVNEITGKDKAYFENTMKQAMIEGRRMLKTDAIGVVVFAHKSTTGWESQLQAMISAGWIVTGSWPIDTENASRLRAQSSAALASSIHLVCRPRENQNDNDLTGDWRDVLAELPNRIHEWMPRLATEGVVGADAIFACLGPALEIFSRYARVEKASGEAVTLKEYLEQVWAVVAKEALNMIFEGADVTGFEEDARLTAMWLWTLFAGNNGKTISDDEGTNNEDTEDAQKTKPLIGYVLEYDAARKIAQGLGAHLDKLKSLVEVKGETARLLPVAERATYLFGKDAGQAPTKRKKKDAQLSLFEFMDQEEMEGDNWQIQAIAKIGHTVLDQLHQSMILFAAGRGEALKRFLVEEGIGRDQRFWRLAQAFSALYPSKSDEKRWVDGVLARKKGLGF